MAGKAQEQATAKKIIRKGDDKMNNLENWTGITMGMYRYVIAAKVCYEIMILQHEYNTDILSAKANLFLTGWWHKQGRRGFFERECLLKEKTVAECIQAAVKDDKENNK